ncbi:unnamed protein product [Thlaspi arvense]|uniref:Uncharacterized protein n=1 Tax=Thlaspi arvense TaxID=13288 RepID=A0AAU9R5R4_THLAR|nr:unnamed protein product [Thlaspi arvense]
MDLYDDIFNDQLLQFSPLCLSPPPEPFTPLMEFLRDPIMEETENVGEVTVGLTPNPPISEANRSTGTHSPNLIPPPETLTLAQNPPEMNMMGSVQQPNDSTMSDIGQQIEEENSRYAHPTMTQSFELPNDLQEQFLSVPLSQSYSSYPTYQHGPVASHFNMYDQQHLPLVLANSEERPLVPRMVTDVARNQENVQEQVNQDLPRFSYPTLDTYAQALPCTNSLSSIQINVLKGRERSYQSHIEYGESSSSAQRRVLFIKMHINLILQYRLN